MGKNTNTDSTLPNLILVMIECKEELLIWDSNKVNLICLKNHHKIDKLGLFLMNNELMGSKTENTNLGVTSFKMLQIVFAPMTIEKIKILGAVLKLPAKQHCRIGQFV